MEYQITSPRDIGPYDSARFKTGIHEELHQHISQVLKIAPKFKLIQSGGAINEMSYSLTDPINYIFLIILIKINFLFFYKLYKVLFIYKTIYDKNCRNNLKRKMERDLLWLLKRIY